MPSLLVNQQILELGPKGCLRRFEDWSEAVAQEMATQEELSLNDCHWAAIRFIRAYYEEFDLPPNPRTLIKEVGAKLHAYHCTRKTVEQMFPNGGCRQACRLAGLPEYYFHAC